MSNTGTTGRIPLWLVGTGAGTAVIALVGIFFIYLDEFISICFCNFFELYTLKCRGNNFLLYNQKKEL